MARIVVIFPDAGQAKNHYRLQSMNVITFAAFPTSQFHTSPRQNRKSPKLLTGIEAVWEGVCTHVFATDEFVPGFTVAAGSKLKSLRNRCNITVRQVEQASRRIAEAKGDKRFRISNGWLAQLENGISEPSICKLFTLSVIYHAAFRDLARLYNVDIDEIEQYESIANPHITQLRPEVHDENQKLLNASRNIGRTCTSLMPQLTTSGNSESQDRRNIRYGYVGLADYTMYPLIRPGALIEIDINQNKLQPVSRHNEFDRPIYFIELREGYACGWCELQGNQLLIIPHHSSPSKVRSFTYPREAEIVGRLVAYNTPCVDSEHQTIEALPLAKKARK